MQWTVTNPNDFNRTINFIKVDGGDPIGGFSVAPGTFNLLKTAIGTHTVLINFGDGETDSLTYTIDVCPLRIPVTGGNPLIPVTGGTGGGGEEVLIPVTGADLTGQMGMGIGFAGMSLAGLALLLSALRKMYNL
jgi:hypothetical protein